MSKILINDITLRDGEQCAGVNFLPNEKLQIARQLVKLGIPIIEAGFPASCDNDKEAVSMIAWELGNDITICAMCRAVKKDIEVAGKALGNAKKGRIQVVMGTSDIHLKHKFNMTRDQALELSVEMVKYAKEFTDDVEFAAEDASRSNVDYLVEVCRACVRAGAKTIELPDTTGYAIPYEYHFLVKRVVLDLPNDIVVATHCHNDLGLALANTLEGIQAGAKQVETTMNGIGERVGNTATEEVVMALKARKDFYVPEYLNLDIDYINTKKIVETSKLVEELSGIKTAHNKAIVGKGAFLHESGIHQDGMIKSPQTYQILNPRDIGLLDYELVVGKLSGKHALEEKLGSMGIFFLDETMEK